MDSDYWGKYTAWVRQLAAVCISKTMTNLAEVSLVVGLFQRSSGLWVNMLMLLEVKHIVKVSAPQTRRHCCRARRDEADCCCKTPASDLTGVFLFLKENFRLNLSCMHFYFVVRNGKWWDEYDNKAWILNDWGFLSRSIRTTMLRIWLKCPAQWLICWCRYCDWLWHILLRMAVTRSNLYLHLERRHKEGKLHISDARKAS